MGDKKPSITIPGFNEWAESWKSGTKLPPKTTERALAEIQSAKPAKEDPTAFLAENNLHTLSIIPVKIEIATKAPIDTVTELQSMYVITSNIIASMLVKWKKQGDLNPMMLGYLKEAESMLKSIHAMTEGVQNQFNLKKMEIAKALIESNDALPNKMRIRLLKEMEAMEVEVEAT